MFEDWLWMWRNGEYGFAIFFGLLAMGGAALAVCLLFLGGNWALGLGRDSFTDEPGVVIARSYSPDTRETHVVPTVVPSSGGGAGVGVGFVASGDPERFFVLVECDGDVLKFESMKAWAKLREGSKVTCRFKHNPQWDSELVGLSW